MKRAFGQGRPVSLFTLGTMRALSSAQQMTAVLREACRSGINHLETAPAYGPAERFLGQALNTLKQECLEPAGGWVITSKLLPGISLEAGQHQLRAILQRLGKTRLDNLAVHGLNRREHLTWALEGEGRDLLQWAQANDLVGQVGFSSHGDDALILEALNSGRFGFCCLHLHLLDPQRLPLAQQALNNGIGVLAISPADKGGRLQAPSRTLIEDCHPIPPLQLAYRFLLSAGISTLSVGAEVESDLQLARKLSAAGGALHPEELDCLNRLRSQREKRLGAELCGQCRACLPCPNHIPIPDLLRLRNLALGHDMIGFSQERYNLIGRAGHWWETVNASACERCMECLPRCPHQLPIPDLLQDTHARLKAAPRRRLWG